MSERASTWCSKGLAVGYGVLSYLVVFLVKYLPGVLEVNSEAYIKMEIPVLV